MQPIEAGIPRRGIKLFEKGVKRSSDANHVQIVEGPKIKIGGAGILSSWVMTPTEGEMKEDWGEYVDDEKVYAVNESGDIILGQGRDLLEKGYGQLFIYIDRATSDLDEMYKKGQIDCLVWVYGDKILRSETQPDTELTAMTFILGGDEREGRSVLIAPNAPLEKINISLETHMEPTLEDEN